MIKSDSIIELSKALSTFQGKITGVKKDSVNPFFKSKYASLDTIWDTIRKPLSDNGLSVCQTLDNESGINMLDTTLMHTSGEWISGSMILNPVKDDPQGLGSAISYGRRYSLSAILGIVADEDDDGNVATKPELKKTTTVKETTTSKPVPTTETTETPRITPAQTKKLYALAKEKNLTSERVKVYMKETFNKTSSKNLTLKEASQLIDDIDKGKLDKEVNAVVEEALKLGAEFE